jgi:hypothetical protein
VGDSTSPETYFVLLVWGVGTLVFNFCVFASTLRVVECRQGGGWVCVNSDSGTLDG